MQKLALCLNRFLNLKAGAFNQEKALIVGAFSVIVKTLPMVRLQLYILYLTQCSRRLLPGPEAAALLPADLLLPAAAGLARAEPQPLVRRPVRAVLHPDRAPARATLQPRGLALPGGQLRGHPRSDTSMNVNCCVLFGLIW